MNRRLSRECAVDIVEQDVEHVECVERGVDGVIFSLGNLLESPGLLMVFEIDGSVWNIVFQIAQNLFLFSTFIEQVPFIFRHRFHGFLVAKSTIAEHAEIIA